MDDLPLVDGHALQIHAAPASVWRALLQTTRRSMSARLPEPVLALWGIEDTRESGAWDDAVVVGDSLLGFHVEAVTPGRLLSLRGRHRFSRYELRFELDTSNERDVTLHAKTFAVFPGSPGRLYRALVIGTGGHGIVVRRLLRSVARRALSQGEVPGTPGKAANRRPLAEAPAKT